MAGFAQDIRYAVRALARAPGFALIAVATIALGIGATTIVYSLVDGILLRPLPIANPDRVVLARELAPSGEEVSLSWPNFVDWKARSTSFENLAVWRGASVNLTGLERPRRIMVRYVSWNLFDVLGVPPALGRGLTESDDVPGAERVCLVSHSLWQRELGGDASAVGRRITLNDQDYTVVGVLPRSFTIARREDAFLPVAGLLAPGSSFLDRGNHNGLAAIGRLPPGATVESARAELATIAAQLAHEYPESTRGVGSAVVRPLLDVLVRQVRPTLLVLLGGVVAMLLIACLNLANLLLARSSSRAQELAVRRALGAPGWRIARQLLTESLLIGLTGGIAGTVLAWTALSAIVVLIPSDQPRVHLIGLDARVLTVTALVSLAAGVLFGLLPAIQGATGRSMALLRSARVTGASPMGNRTRGTLLVAQVSMALVLLAGAGLMVRTMQNLLAIAPGFDADRVLTAQVLLPVARYSPEQRRAFYRSVVDRVRALPGVSEAALTNSLPVLNANWTSVFMVGDQPVPARAELPSAAMTPVTPGYHETMRIPLLRGRLLQPSDSEQSASVAVVNESFARRFWPDGDAVGQRLKQGWPESDAPWREIVGVVGDVKIGGLDQSPGLQVYFPLAQNPTTLLAVVARVRGEAATLTAALEAAVHAVDPNLPVYDIQTLNEIIGRDVGQERLTMVFLMGFAAMALLLAAVGVFGVTAYGVSQRTHELGVRMALGASRGSVVRLVMRHELIACAMGIAAGLGAALALAPGLQSLLYGVPPRDPATLIVVAAVLIAVTAVAAYLPARRAVQVNPVEALRME